MKKVLYSCGMDTADYLVTIIKPMVKHPDYVSVAESQDPMGILLTLDLHKEDMGIVCGKGGETAKSIRTLVRIVGFTSGARVSVKINEPKII